MRARIVRHTLLLLAFFTPAIPALAQTPLRWNLKPGESLAVTIDQTTDSDVSFTGKKAMTKIELTLVLGWNVLPDRPINVGETWSVSSERPTVAGPLKIDSTYKLAGLANQNGQPIAQIAMSANFTPAAGGQLTVKSSEHSGDIQFAVNIGRPI